MADLTGIPLLVPGVALQDVETDVLAYDGDTLTHLSGATAAVARAVDGVRSVADLARDLDVDAAEAVDLLVGRGLVELGEPSSDQRYRRPDHVGACVDGGRVVLIDLRTGERHVLEAGGSAIWELVTCGHTSSSAAAELDRVHPGSGAAHEAIRLVEQLVELGLLAATTPPR